MNPRIVFVTINSNDFDGELQQIILYNIQGQKIYSTDVKNQAKVVDIKTNNFSEGIYILQFQTDKGILNKKLIITK